MAIIKAPNEQFNGVRNGLIFVAGQAESDDETLFGYFLERGYDVEGKEPEVSNPEEDPLQALKDVAKELKVKGYTKMSEDELLEAIEKAQK
jgi:hypothetical protein